MSQKRGWCPSLNEPMPSGDGLLVRVKPPAARLTPNQARALAAAATRHGNAIMELTQRGNIQVRGLTPATTAPFAAAMVEAGLALPDPNHERRRPVMPPPLLGDDPGIPATAAAFTEALEHACRTDHRLDGLPGKFAIHVDAGGLFQGRQAAATLIARLDGTLAAASHTPAPPLAGPLPYPGTTDMAYAAAPPFGQFDARMLEALAAVAEHHGTTIRLTPWRALLLGRLPQSTLPLIDDAWITHPADPRLQVTACIGAPGCRSGTTDTRTDAARLAQALHPTQRLHVSGCSKGCAHPAPASLTFTARDGAYDIIHNGKAADPPVRSGIRLPLAIDGLALSLIET